MAMHKAVCSTTVNQAFKLMSIAPSSKLKQSMCIFINNVRYPSVARISKNVGGSPCQSTLDTGDDLACQKNGAIDYRYQVAM